MDLHLQKARKVGLLSERCSGRISHSPSLASISIFKSMEQAAKHRTKVPSHLRPFHRRASRTKSHGPFTAQQSHSTTDLPSTDPPRFRLSLRSALKDVVCKDWRGLAQHVQPEWPPMVFPPRPDPIRMKDSDDYITERAANPRTGLISPSLASTPCRASTPNTPGDALKLLRNDHESPTPIPRRSLLSRANEGSKISAGSSWAHGEQEAYCGGERGGTPCTLPQDRLVMHMPSAKEPQPFAYPGYTSEQIEAYEHYRLKARRVSSEGYDRRLIQNSRNPSSSYSTPDHEATPDESDDFPCLSRQGHPFQTYGGMHERPQPQLVVRKRRTVKPACQANGTVSTLAERPQRGVELPNTILKPSLTCDIKRDECCHECHGILSGTASGDCCTSKPAQQPHKAPPGKTFKQSCMAPSRGSVQDVAKVNHSDKENAPNGYFEADSSAPDMTDLRTLPRVTLVRPEHADMPGLRGHRHPSGVEGGRSCSLGCHRDVTSGQCLEQRKVSLPIADDRLFSAEGHRPDGTGKASTEKVEEVLVGLLSWLLCYIKGIQIPQSDLIETLRSSTATTKEKADALKAALSLAGHVLAVGTALAMIWQLSAAVIQLLQIALWPLAVPFRILRWLLGAA